MGLPGSGRVPIVPLTPEGYRLFCTGAFQQRRWFSHTFTDDFFASLFLCPSRVSAMPPRVRLNIGLSFFMALFSRLRFLLGRARARQHEEEAEEEARERDGLAKAFRLGDTESDADEEDGQGRANNKKKGKR